MEKTSVYVPESNFDIYLVLIHSDQISEFWKRLIFSKSRNLNCDTLTWTTKYSRRSESEDQKLTFFKFHSCPFHVIHKVDIKLHSFKFPKKSTCAQNAMTFMASFLAYQKCSTLLPGSDVSKNISHPIAKSVWVSGITICQDGITAWALPIKCIRNHSNFFTILLIWKFVILRSSYMCYRCQCLIGSHFPIW